LPQEADTNAYRRELEINTRNRYREDGNNADPDNELTDRDAIPVAHGESDGPPSRRTRAAMRAAANLNESALANWDSYDMLPLIEFESVGVLCINVMQASTDVPATYYDCLQTPEAEEW
jgi:hypothetical protein